MIEQLFGSKTRVKLLQLFYTTPDRAYYVREITRKIDEQINSVRRELANLLSIGIITSDTSNNKLYYQVNKKYEYFNPLSTIFSEGSVATELTHIDDKKDAIAPAHSLADRIQKLGNVELALLTGVFVRDERPGVDLVLVGDMNHTQVHKFIAELEKEESKELRFTVHTLTDWKYRLQINDRFAATIVTSKNIVVIDKHHFVK